MSGALRLTPSFREKVWGSKHLAPWFANPSEPVGEIWYEAAKQLPLLVKWIFTTDRLSVQVHPDETDGVPVGKTEMWHILAAEPGASIALGFRRPITREQLREAVRSSAVEDLLNWVPAKAGDTFFARSHTVHAIGGGIVLCEIQQNSDITYRLWDYGRPRELHVEQAIPIADLGVHPGAVPRVRLREGRDLLACCEYFATELVSFFPGETHRPQREFCHVWICLEGRGRIGEEPIGLADAWLMPEAGESPVIAAGTGMKFLRTYVPPAYNGRTGG
jgi:mannose-6-phosphate isomerase